MLLEAKVPANNMTSVEKISIASILRQVYRYRYAY
jgi:hypothetical protein